MWSSPNARVSFVYCIFLCYTSACTADILRNVIELKPPKWMPWGNVGTPTSYFFNLIKRCQLDSSIISKLGLSFTGLAKQRKYGAVFYAYDNGCSDTVEDALIHSECAQIRSQSGRELVDDGEFQEFIDTKVCYIHFNF